MCFVLINFSFHSFLLKGKVKIKKPKAKDWVHQSHKDVLHPFFLYQLPRLVLLQHLHRVILMLYAYLTPTSRPVPLSRPVLASMQALVSMPTPSPKLLSTPRLTSTAMLTPTPNQKKTIRWNTTSSYLMLILMI